MAESVCVRERRGEGSTEQLRNFIQNVPTVGALAFLKSVAEAMPDEPSSNRILVFLFCSFDFRILAWILFFQPEKTRSPNILIFISGRRSFEGTYEEQMQIDFNDSFMVAWENEKCTQKKNKRDSNAYLQAGFFYHSNY